MKSKLRTIAIWTALLTLLLATVTALRTPDAAHVDFASFLAAAEAGEVAEVRIEDNHLTAKDWAGNATSTLGMLDEEQLQRLSEQGVAIHWGPESRPLRTLVIYGLPLVLLIGLFLYFLRKHGGGAGMNIMELKKSRARLLSEHETVKFDAVGGCEEAKAQLGDVVDFLKHPERWQDAQVRLPRGVLLEGPPGCGKTLLARAVAGETDASFFTVSGSDFVEIFVGVGASRMRDMFEMAAKEAPAIVFIDELDAIGRRRGSGIGPTHEEREQTLNQLLVSLDGFASSDRVVVIAATNRPDVLDAALVRPGRFDRRVRIPELDALERRAVLGIHTRGKRLAGDVDLGALAERTAGFTGARLESLVNEAGLLAVRRARADGRSEVCVSAADFVQAFGLGIGAAGAGLFDQVDALLMESTSQLAQATGKARIRVTLSDGVVVEGELVWADAMFLKIRGDEAGAGVLVSKNRVKTIEALEGTEGVASEDLAPDRWSSGGLHLA